MDTSPQQPPDAAEDPAAADEPGRDGSPAPAEPSPTERSADDEGTTRDAGPTNEPRGNPPVDEEVVREGLDRLEQAGGGH